MLKTHPRAAAGLQLLSLLARALAVALLLSWALQLADAQTTPGQREQDDVGGRLEPHGVVQRFHTSWFLHP